MNEQENKRELRGKLIRAKDIEEVRALLGPETAEEEIKQVWREIEAHRPAEGLETVDDDELAAVSGGADRNWVTQGCSATVEEGSWCGSDDYCNYYDVTYSNFDPCTDGGLHDYQYAGKKEGLRFLIATQGYLSYVCSKCQKEKKVWL